MRETKFGRGEKVIIRKCPIMKRIEGAKGTVVRVCVDGSGRAYYKVRVGTLYVPNYAMDEHLEKVVK